MVLEKNQGLFASPLEVTDREDCFFYHTMELPGHGVVEGGWDIRHNVGEFFGELDLAGKTVLEIGPGSGFFSFYMESQGAKVTCVELADGRHWDIVPFLGKDLDQVLRDREENIRKLINSFWFSHKALNSKVRVHYGGAYDIPDALGPVDVCTFASVLIHLRDPFRALQGALRLTRETVVITERVITEMTQVQGGALMSFVPDPRTQTPHDSWWHFHPYTLAKMIAILGFEEVEFMFHSQRHSSGEELPMYTLIGTRTLGKEAF